MEIPDVDAFPADSMTRMQILAVGGPSSPEIHAHGLYNRIGRVSVSMPASEGFRLWFFIYGRGVW